MYFPVKYVIINYFNIDVKIITGKVSMIKMIKINFISLRYDAYLLHL